MQKQMARVKIFFMSAILVVCAINIETEICLSKKSVLRVAANDN